MKMASEVLLKDLRDQTNFVLEEVLKYELLTLNQLNKKLNPESWSILECIEHLNRYGRFYIPELSSCIESGRKPSAKIFKSGWLGNYFAKSMLPKEKLNTMKTFKSMNPVGSQLDKSTLDEFKTQQRDLLNLLEKAKQINLTKTKTSISISQYIKLRIGDTFRVVIYHNLRHIAQANRIID